ncbi:MAG: LLM class flavin-dependent oxidoreductase [Pseudomonadaceae bacterium]|nr:LLM class flavin-dependent oxidoreductase [Pseudomonadaceae bacterium]
MHIGITPWEMRDLSAASLSSQAHRAEQLGFESFFLPENHFSAGALPEPLMLLAAVASATSTIRLGTTSYLLPVRHPIAAAEQVAVLDQLCNGRVILGLGRGFAANMFTAFGVDSRQKRQIFTDNLNLMLRAWAGEAIEVDADKDAIEIHPLPVQRPHPELWVAAFGPKALAQVAALNLPYLASPMEPLSVLAANYQSIRDSGTSAGELVGVPVMRSVFVSTNRNEVEAVRRGLVDAKFPRQEETIEVDDWALVGDPAFVSDQVARYRETLGMTHLIVTRPRVQGLPLEQIERSVALIADTLIAA